jgi:predicted DNA binding CopG/RHH family protein
MNKTKLDREEKALLEAFEADEFQSGLTPSRKKMIEAAAAQAFKKDKRINIRISGRDLTAIQRQAMEQGMPYQTLIASIIHKYASGSLYDATAKNVVDANN